MNPYEHAFRSMTLIYTVPDLALQHEGEGRYLKAYERYLAGWRDRPPVAWTYGIDPERAEHIRTYAKAVAHGLAQAWLAARAEQS